MFLPDLAYAVGTLLTNQKARAVSARTTSNLMNGLPISANLLVTPLCQADCDFCGFGIKANKDFVKERLRESYIGALEPLHLPSLTISGGEPLLRKDIERIVYESVHANGIPLVRLVTNGQLLTLEKYKLLADAGLDEIVISLDFASDKHSKMRGLPGLYGRIAGLLPLLADESRKGGPWVRLNVIAMNENIRDIHFLVSKAEEEKVLVSISAYSPGRNSNTAHMPTKADVPELKQALDYLLEAKKRSRTIVTSASELKKIFGFLGGVPAKNCKAGNLFLYVDWAGRYMPCPAPPHDKFATLREAQDYETARRCVDCAASCRLVPEQIAGSSCNERVHLGAELARAYQRYGKPGYKM